MRLFKGLLYLAALILVPFAAITAVAVALTGPLNPPLSADYIVVISGPGPETAERTAVGVELFDSVRETQRLILSGGTGAAEDMRAQAIVAGVDPQHIITENASRSTLQNGLFVRDLGIAPNDRIVVVTHKYHEFRTFASFRWAGFRNVRTVAVDAENPTRFEPQVFTEVIKWPVNILRAVFASTMMAFDAPREAWVEWLN